MTRIDIMAASEGLPRSSFVFEPTEEEKRGFMSMYSEGTTINSRQPEFSDTLSLASPTAASNDDTRARLMGASGSWMRARRLYRTIDPDAGIAHILRTSGAILPRIRQSAQIARAGPNAQDQRAAANRRTAHRCNVRSKNPARSTATEFSRCE